MKIEVKERGSREYYDEFLYIAANYRKFQKNPRRKTHLLTRVLIANEVFIAVAMLLILLFYHWYPDVIFIFYLGILVLALVIYAVYHISIEKRIRDFLNDDGLKSISITGDRVEYADEEKAFGISWNEIAAVIFGRYGICFLPKGKEGILISLSSRQEEEVLEGIREAGKEERIVRY